MDISCNTNSNSTSNRFGSSCISLLMTIRIDIVDIRLISLFSIYQIKIEMLSSMISIFISPRLGLVAVVVITLVVSVLSSFFLLFAMTLLLEITSSLILSMLVFISKELPPNFERLALMHRKIC